MDNARIGALICALRKERSMTQLQLAQRLGVSDKAVSKWERGMGCPDISLFPDLSALFGVELSALLAGDMGRGELLGGNMKKLRFYVCPVCGNLLTAMSDSASVSCCGKLLEPLSPHRASEDECLHVEKIETEYFISSAHPMTRAHHIAFVALVTGDCIVLRKQYPEWDLQARIPMLAHGRLVWYCTQDGLFEQLL